MTSGEVHDVLSHGHLGEKKVVETWGGTTYLQLQAQLQKGVGRLQVGKPSCAVVALALEISVSSRAWRDDRQGLRPVLSFDLAG